MGVASRHVEGHHRRDHVARHDTVFPQRAGGGDGPRAPAPWFPGPRGVRASRPRKCSYAKSPPLPQRRGATSGSERLRKGGVREAPASSKRSSYVTHFLVSTRPLLFRPGPHVGAPAGHALVTGPARRLHLCLDGKHPPRPADGSYPQEEDVVIRARRAQSARARARRERRGPRGHPRAWPCRGRDAGSKEGALAPPGAPPRGTLAARTWPPRPRLKRSPPRPTSGEASAFRSKDRRSGLAGAPRACHSGLFCARRDREVQAREPGPPAALKGTKTESQGRRRSG